MPPELSLEELASKVDKTLKIASTLKAQNDEDKEKHEAQNEEEEKEKEAKKAQEEEEKKEENKEARKARYNSMKKAMEEKDEEKRDAAIRAAMEENKPSELKEAEEDEKKEEQANVASIINDKKSEFISKILTANKIFNPSKIKQIQSRIMTANLTALKKEWSVIEPFLAAMPKPESKPEAEENFIPFFANITPEDVDKNQLNANSPDSAFAQLSTKELLEMTR